MADTFPGSDFARVPPHNLDAERSALGGVLVKPVMFDELATALGTDDFFLPAHREIFDAMMEISHRRQPIDVVSLGDELKSRGSLGDWKAAPHTSSRSPTPCPRPRTSATTCAW